MNWHDLLLALRVFLGAFGAVPLLAGILTFNTVLGERSKQDGRTFAEKQMSGSWQEWREARTEMSRLLPATWAKQRVTRVLVYLGATLLVLALFVLG